MPFTVEKTLTISGDRLGKTSVTIPYRTFGANNDAFIKVYRNTKISQMLGFKRANNKYALAGATIVEDMKSRRDAEYKRRAKADHLKIEKVDLGLEGGDDAIDKTPKGIGIEESIIDIEMPAIGAHGPRTIKAILTKPRSALEMLLNPDTLTYLSAIVEHQLEHVEETNHCVDENPSEGDVIEDDVVEVIEDVIEDDD